MTDAGWSAGKDSATTLGIQRNRSVVPVRGAAIPRILADESGVFGT